MAGLALGHAGHSTASPLALVLLQQLLGSLAGLDQLLTEMGPGRAAGHVSTAERSVPFRPSHVTLLQQQRRQSAGQHSAAAAAAGHGRKGASSQ